MRIVSCELVVENMDRSFKLAKKEGLLLEPSFLLFAQHGRNLIGERPHDGVRGGG